jgi:inhibitor of KinA
MYDQPRLLPAGDSALVVEFGNEIAPEINARIRSFTQALEEQALTGIVELVPTYRSVLIHYDPLQIDPRELEENLQKLAAGLTDLELAAPEVTMVPVCYGGEFGPDLDHVCQHTGLSKEEVIRLHTGTNYLIYMLGFTPGFPTWAVWMKGWPPPA